MSLLTAENKPAFESDTDTDDAPLKVEVAPAATPAPTAVATTKPMGLALPNSNVMAGFKNAIPVAYNTLEAIIATNGNFVSRETKKVLGDQVTFELLSFQDAFVISPGDDKAPDDLVRYSDDGVTCSDGTPVKEHLDFLRQSWPKAAIKPRTVLVAALKTTSKPVGMEDVLVQFDLSPASKTMWDRYMVNVAYKVSVGKLSVEQGKLVTATAELANSGANTYTLAKFSLT